MVNLWYWVQPMSHKKTPPKPENPTRNSSFFGFRLRSQIASPYYPVCVSVVSIRLAYQLKSPQTANLALESANRNRYAPQTKKRLQKGKLTCLFKDAWQEKIIAHEVSR